jgi:hypothetical protein
MLKIDSHNQLYLQTIFDLSLAHRVVREFHPDSPLVESAPNMHDGRRLQLLELVETADGIRPINYAFQPKEKDVILDAFRKKAGQPDPDSASWDIAQSRYLLDHIERPVTVPRQRHTSFIRSFGRLAFSH